MVDVVALVLGAGRGERLGAELPKASVRVAGHTLLHWSATALGRAVGVHAVLPVIGPVGSDAAEELAATWTGPATLLAAAFGGETRQESVARGLEALAEQAPEAEWVLVHDAARCLVQAEDAEAVLAAASTSGAAVPIVPVSDTIKEISGDRITATPDRSRLARALTPQAFRLSLLREAVDKADREGFQGTDCSSLVERLGVPVHTCAGRVENFKVTDAGDLARAESVLQKRAAP
jgi:2-C-methyl-D-erythritol 4-phosphate cytidylyltransferase/2-C-methyl-D-erythritol 2,4-cyclodiphosphate synthase